MKSDLKGKRIFVTGGSGFVGGRLVESLVLDHQAEVRALVHRAYSGALRMARFNVEFVQGDITDHAAMQKATQGCDIVFHLACGNSGSPAEKKRITVEGTRALVRAALDNQVSRFVFASTAAVYFGAEDCVVDENSPRRRWGWDYSDDKLTAENIVMRHCRKHGLPGTILQLACVHGPWGETFTINPLAQLRAGRVVLVNGGDGISNATYVDDAVQALLLGAVRHKAVGETFIIKGPRRVTYRELYERYERMLGVKSVVGLTPTQIRRELRSLRRKASQQRRPTGQTDSERTGTDVRGADKTDPRPLIFPSEPLLPYYAAKIELSTKKAENLLGYSPRYDLSAGMRRTEEWARWARLIP
jgi:nucleoside-diphosphate-sugar epimerase